MNDTQRGIVGASILVVGFVLMFSVIDVMVSGVIHDGVFGKAMDLDETWPVWIVGLTAIGAAEYYLFGER